MEIPSINFNYSPTYDKEWSLALGKSYNFDSSRERARNFIDDFKLNFWTPRFEKEVLEKISSFSGLEWGKEPVQAYVVNNLRIPGFSRPFTIKISKDNLFACHVMVHELVHTIFNRNLKSFKNVLGSLREEYPKMRKDFLVHLVIIPIENKVLSNVLDSSEFEDLKKKARKIKGFEEVYNFLSEYSGNFYEDYLRCC